MFAVLVRAHSAMSNLIQGSDKQLAGRVLKLAATRYSKPQRGANV